MLEHLVRDGVVFRVWNGGEGRIIGFLDDAANLGDALLTLYEATGDPRYFTAALRSLRAHRQQHRDADGNYFDTAGDSEPLIVRPRTIDDNPVSAGAVGCGDALLPDARVHRRGTLVSARMEIIAPLVDRGRPSAARGGRARGRDGAAIGPMREIAIAGDADDPRTRALVETVQRRFDPLAVLAWGPVRRRSAARGTGTPGGRRTRGVCLPRASSVRRR